MAIIHGRVKMLDGRIRSQWDHPTHLQQDGLLDGAREVGHEVLVVGQVEEALEGLVLGRRDGSHLG